MPAWFGGEDYHASAKLFASGVFIVMLPVNHCVIVFPWGLRLVGAPVCSARSGCGRSIQLRLITGNDGLDRHGSLFSVALYNTCAVEPELP